MSAVVRKAAGRRPRSVLAAGLLAVRQPAQPGKNRIIKFGLAALAASNRKKQETYQNAE